MGRIEKTVFISYRRTNVPWALAIYQNLTMHGYDVFFDYQSIDSGSFEKIILENIKTRAHFIAVLTPSALERCNEPGDWLRREIETAIEEKRNIIPLMLDSFDFASPLVTQALTGNLATLKTYNGLRVYSEYFFEAMDKLRDKYLNVEVSGIALPPLNSEAEKITEAQKSAASEAAPVEKQQLTAQELFEKGYKSKDIDESIRFYTEAISLEPDFAEAYYNRGNIRRDRVDLSGAMEDYDQAIRINSSLADAFGNRGAIRFIKGDLEGARNDLKKVIRLRPNDGISRSTLINVLRKLGRTAEAALHEKIAHKLIQKENEYNQACFQAICGNTERALGLLKTALEMNQARKEWVKQDPDFENIRDDPRFKALVGE